MKTVSVLARLSLVSATAAALAACNGGAEPYPADWTASGLWEPMYTDIHMESRYSNREAHTNSPRLDAFTTPPTAVTVTHMAGATSLMFDGLPATVDPTTGSMTLTLSSIGDSITPNCVVDSSQVATFDFSRDRLTAVGVSETTLTFRSVGSPVGCATYFNEVAQYFRMNNAFPAGVYGNLPVFVFGGAVDLSALPFLESLHLTVYYDLINTSPAQELAGALATPTVDFFTSTLRQLFEAGRAGHFITE